MVVRSSARTMVPSARPLRTAEGAGEVRVGRRSGARRSAALPAGREVERAAERAVGERQPSGEPARVGAQVAARMRAAGIERGDGDHRRRFVRQQDLPVAGERPELRAAAGAIIEARRGRSRAAGASRVMPSASLGRSRNMSILGRSIWPSRTSFSGPYFACRPAATMWKVPSLEALARARQPQLGRIELEVGEMDDPVAAALEVGRERRQPAGQVAEEAVVEPAHPGLAGADDVGAVTVRRRERP